MIQIEGFQTHVKCDAATGEETIWLVPLVEICCPDCNGTGKSPEWFIPDDERERDDCYECDGKGRIKTAMHDRKLTYKEWLRQEHQRKLLIRRYGTMPRSIRDYWLRGAQS